jgi:DNA-binding NtrC family response regulator
MPASASPARILVADDESSIRIGCHKILSEDGHEVVTVADGLAAVEAFRASAFDLVLLDLSMPGLDGLQVIPRLRELDPSAVVVMITGYASFETAVQAIQAGAYDYVPKPFTPSELRIVVKRALEKRALIVERLELQRERERSLKDLAFEQSRTRTIINAMAEPLLVVNAARELVFVNPAARRFLAEGRSAPGSRCGKPWACQS